MTKFASCLSIAERKMFKSTRWSAKRSQGGTINLEINFKRLMVVVDFKMNRVINKQKEIIVGNINKNQVKNAIVLIATSIEL